MSGRRWRCSRCTPRSRRRWCTRRCEPRKWSSTVCNAFHALKVCFSNEIGDLCQALGADAHEVMRIFRLDRKLNVSEAYLKPGFAFGGSCLPKDVRALVAAARANDLAVPLLSAVMPANDGQIVRGLDEVLDTHKQRIGIVGLAFKPGTDDLRESPMVALVERLIGKGRDVRIFDPRVSMAQLVGANKRFIETEIPHIASLLCSSVDDLVAHAEVLVFSAPGPGCGSRIATRHLRTDAARFDTRDGLQVGRSPVGNHGLHRFLTGTASVVLGLALVGSRIEPSGGTGSGRLRPMAARVPAPLRRPLSLLYRAPSQRATPAPLKRRSSRARRWTRRKWLLTAT